MSLPQVAVFWNFENLHDRVVRHDQYELPVNRRRTSDQPGVVNVRDLAEFISQQGTVVLNQAYANWQPYAIYGHPLATAGVRLVQVFPVNPNPAGSSVEMIREDAVRLSQNTDDLKVIIIGGDPTFLATIDELRRVGVRPIVGVNLHQEGDDEWEARCDHFLDYQSLGRPLRGTHPEAAVRETHAALIAAFQKLERQGGRPWIRQAMVKPALVNVLPTFDERDYGYLTLAGYLEDQSALLERRRLASRYAFEYRLRPELQLNEPARGAADLALLDAVAHYGRIAAQQGLRLPNPVIMWVGIDIYAAIVEDQEEFYDFAALDEECLFQLQEDYPRATITDARKIRQVLFKCYIFSPSQSKQIRFQEDLGGLKGIEDRYFDLLTDRVVANTPGAINWKAMSLAFTGEEKYADRMRATGEERLQLFSREKG